MDSTQRWMIPELHQATVDVRRIDSKVPIGVSTSVSHRAPEEEDICVVDPPNMQRLDEAIATPLLVCIPDVLSTVQETPGRAGSCSESNQLRELSIGTAQQIQSIQDLLQHIFVFGDQPR